MIRSFRGLLLITLTMACASEERAAELPLGDDAEAGYVEWSYSAETGPEVWGELSSDFSTCSAGMAQSPIDIQDTVAQLDDLPSLITGYGLSELHVEASGHGRRLTPSATQTLSIGGDAYVLLQLHAHNPSEHTIDGRSYPLEMHFVHVDSAGGLAVVGVLFQEGGTNEFFQPIVEALRDSNSATLDDIGRLLPSSGNYFTYAGSLTTPPCTEDVRWIVLRETLELSNDQISAFSADHGTTNRPVQPLNGRTVHTLR